MSMRRQPRLALILFMAAVCILTLAPAARGQGKKYTLTIYVNEGPDTTTEWLEGSSRFAFTGHVFVGLSDGSGTEYRGFYRNRGNTVVDDYEDAATRNYDLKKTFPVTEEGYRKAMQAAGLGPLQNEQWRKELPHCGAYAEAMARLAGVPVGVPERMDSKVTNSRWMRTRPGNFADYLRAGSPEGYLVLIPQDMRNKPDPDFFPGTWRAEGGRTVVIVKEGKGFTVKGALPGQKGDYFREFRVDGETLISQHQITAAEVREFNLPASVVNQVVGAAPVQMILEMSKNARAIKATHNRISGVNVGRLYRNGRPTNQYRINEFVPKTTHEIWERVR